MFVVLLSSELQTKSLADIESVWSIKRAKFDLISEKVTRRQACELYRGSMFQLLCFNAVFCAK